jgi:hypothetical protein
MEGSLGFYSVVGVKFGNKTSRIQGFLGNKSRNGFYSFAH